MSQARYNGADMKPNPAQRAFGLNIRRQREAQKTHLHIHAAKENVTHRR